MSRILVPIEEFNHPAKILEDIFYTQSLLHSQIPDQTGKVAIVTGANTGLGYATAVALAGNGAHVFFACRNERKALDAIERAKLEIKEHYLQASEPKLEFLELDLNDMKKTRQSARNFLERNLPLHILICNAGVNLAPYELSADDRLKETKPSRVVILSSIAHEETPNGEIEFERLTLEQDNIMNPLQRYCRAKLANILFAKALARRLEEESVYVVRTEINRHAAVGMSKLIEHATDVVDFIFGVKAHIGCLTQLYLAVSPEVEEKDIRGRYFIPIANEILPHPSARNVELQENYGITA
ncbi:hypothetical protein BGZ49_005624 [Haplosporangium sp. Z 27]|nr:hypothetical protein BGZ49_005624 [Haplosporangium sp. Z 27]